MLLVAQIDLVGEVVVKIDVGLAGEGVLGDRLEGLLHVDRFLRRRLEVGNIALGLAPLLSALHRHLPDGKWGEAVIENSLL